VLKNPLSNLANLLNKTRVLRNEYRYGILGVDDPISPNSEFYQVQNKRIVERENKSKEHLSKRQRLLAKNHGVSEQIEFSTNDQARRKDKMHHEISPFWSRKKRVGY